MSKVFYMPPPSIMGVWDSAPQPEYKDEESVFKFTMEDGSDEAAYSVCDSVPAHRAVLGGLRRGWTSACCDSANFAPANAVSVIHVKDGTAVRQSGGKWTVKQKAVIDYPA